MAMVSKNQTIKPWIIAVVAAALLSLTTALGVSEPDNNGFLLEPTIKQHVGVLPSIACQELIALGEVEGFTVGSESIDDDEKNYNVISQSIDVFERNDGVTSPAIWKSLEPYIPQLTELVRKSIDPATDISYFPDKPDRVPQLDWVFFRKYSPNSDRNSLKLHVDSNMHTLNIALNDDFDGGGFFYVKPPVDQEDNTYDGRPTIPDSYRDYKWLNDLKRNNTSDLIFPTLQTGDVLVYNFTVWHAVAPLDVGTRYSFTLFYDMDNPAIQADFEEEEDEINVVFYHEIQDLEIDLVFVEETNEGQEEIIEILEKNMPPFREIEMSTYDGHLFRAMISGTDSVVSEFVMRDDMHEYRIVKEEVPNDEL